MNELTNHVASGDGFDAAVKLQKDDHLNRWPFAQEIYNMAVKGPEAWSLRAGVYGAWGTGKTSVLEFVADMGTEGGHVVVWFDPWEFSKKEDLWRAFVLKIIEKIEAKVGGLVEAGNIRRRMWFSKALGGAPTILGAWKEDAKNATDKGLGLLRNYLAPKSQELEAVRKALSGRKVIVLIDDLDRTAAELVPEILFALKELVDIPGFCFICAFDPVVVGKVLRQHHRGFGDGMKFLEKIIDYPRWLPPPSADGLVKLALQDAKQNCPFVPESAICGAVPLLPSNPRAIRQFIRLLALLQPQIARYYDHELRWPVIIASNVLKVRHPRIAHPLLRNRAFWGNIGVASMHAARGNEEIGVDKIINDHIENTSKSECLSINEQEKSELHIALNQLGQNFSIFAGWDLEGGKVDSDGMAGQADIAEAPEAVTWKEFDQFLDDWKATPEPKKAQEWIARHVKSGRYTEERVFSEVFCACVQSYCKALQQADNVIRAQEREPWVTKADLLMRLLECLTELADLDLEYKKIAGTDLDYLFQKFYSLANSNLSVHTNFWPRSESYILRMMESWKGDLLPLIKVTHQYEAFRHQELNTTNAEQFFEKIRSFLLPKFASQIIEGFKTENFISKILNANDEFASRTLLVSLDEPLWKEKLPNILKILGDAQNNLIVQANAYDFLLAFGYKMKNEKGYGDTANFEKLFANDQIAKAVWKAATATPLSLRGIIGIGNVPENLKHLGIELVLPTWWKSTLDELKTHRPKA